jgi:two-component system, OmpR family, phosphate regulon sensor histidine kinase PhoR
VLRTAPLKLLALFLLLSGIPLAALGWLGHRVLQQERALEAQRQRDQLENAAAALTRDLDRRLTALEGLLPVAAAGQAVALPADTVFIVSGGSGVVRHEGVPLPYYPHIEPRSSPVPASRFAAAEASEFGHRDLTAAIAAYRELSLSPIAPVRAEALMRLARCLRRQQRTADALVTYAALAALGPVRVAGAPAGLVAHRERIVLMQGAGDAAGAAREQSLLAAALSEGRFEIDRATYDYFQELASSPPSHATDLAAAVDALSAAWMEQRSGRAIWTRGPAAFVSVWRTTAAGTASLTAPIERVAASLAESLSNLRVTAQLDDRSGRRIWGGVAKAPEVTRTSRETGLPWTLHVAAADAPAGGPLVDARRNLFLAGFVLMALVIGAAGYFVCVAVNRELGVARLQSEFVAAVSHEFRTPLTAMCHLTEILERGDGSPARLPAYYHALGKESRRLHDMVENLLDFGRIDAGRRTYDFSEMNAVDLVERVAEEYADRSPASAARIETSLPSRREALTVTGDREALMLAVRNLVDNAMKYSPGDAPVRLSVSHHDGTVAVSVQDRGAGISRDERAAIFAKFTRGHAARALNVKGTGIGLTMAKQIVKAHRGWLEVDSEPGRGSTFTIHLPEAS